MLQVRILSSSNACQNQNSITNHISSVSKFTHLCWPPFPFSNEYTDFVYFDIGREKIEDFLDDIVRPFGRDKVRIKLNNEREIADE